jgi:hypothetical protein
MRPDNNKQQEKQTEKKNPTSGILASEGLLTAVCCFLRSIGGPRGLGGGGGRRSRGLVCFPFAFVFAAVIAVSVLLSSSSYRRKFRTKKSEKTTIVKIRKRKADRKDNRRGGGKEKGKGREGKGREGKGREGKRREGKGPGISTDGRQLELCSFHNSGMAMTQVSNLCYKVSVSKISESKIKKK